MKKKYSYPSWYLKLFLFTLLIVNANAFSQSCTVNAGLDRTICVNESLVLDGTTGGDFAINAIWKQISGPSVIISDPNIDDPTITGFLGGNMYQFELSATCDNGSTPSQIVTITVVDITIADAGNDVASCPNDSGSIVVSANTPNALTGETGVWSFLGGNPAGVVINDVNSPTTVIELPETSAGETTLVWTITSSGGTCESTDQVTVTNYGGVEPVDAGADEVLDGCYTVSQSTNLAGSFGGNNINSQVGIWSFVSGPSLPTIADVNNNATGVSDLVEGVYVFRWDVSGPCATGSDTVTITVLPATQDVTNASAGVTQRICDASVTQVSVVGNNANFADEIVLWEQIDGQAAVTIVDNASSATQITNLVPPVSGTKTYRFRYTIENAVTGCTTTDTVSVIYNIANISIDANAGMDVQLACDTTEADITYSSVGGDRTEYSIVSGPSDSALTFPTSYVNLGSSSSGTVSVDDFDAPGVYILNFVRRRTGGLLLGCEQANSTIKVYVSTNPSGSNAGTNQTFACGQVNGSLSGSATTIGETSFWSLLSGDHGLDNTVIDDRYAQSPNITGLVPGTYTFQYEVSSGINCPPAVSTTTVVVTPLSNLPVNAGAVQTVCYNAPVQLSADALRLSQVGVWSSPDGVTFSDPNDPNAIATGFLLPNTDYTLTWTVDEAAGYPDCGAPAADTVVITTSNNESPTIANAGVDQCLALGTITTSLSANNTVPLEVDELGVWTQVTGPSVAVFSPSINDPNATVSNLVNGQYEFRWTVDNTPPSVSCSPTTDTVEILIANTSSSSSAGVDQDVCVVQTTGSFLMNADDPASVGGIGTWKLVSGNTGYTVDDINSPTAEFSNLSNGTYVFEWEILFGNCPSSAANDQVTINVGLEPTAANITSGFTSVCNASQTLINADPLLNPNEESGFWSVVSGPNTPTIDDASSNNINVTNLVTGQYTFRWTIISGSILCADKTDDITFDVYKASEPITSIDVCEVTSVFLEATAGTTGLWSLVTVNGGAPTALEITNHSPTQSLGNNSTANANVVPGDVYVYEYTTDYPGACGNTTEQVTVTISEAPSVAPNAGPDDTLCLDDPTPGVNTSLNITSGNGVIPADVTTATWSVLSQPVGASASFDVAINDLTPTLEGLTVPGLYIIQLNFSTGSCTDLADIARIEVFEAPKPVEAGTDIASACQLDYVTDATTPDSGIGTWTITSHPAGSANTATIDNVNNPITSLSDIEVGTYVLTWTVSNGSPYLGGTPCGPQSDTVTITFPALPPSEAVAGPDQEFCDATTTFLGATPLAEGTGVWTIESQPGGSTVSIVSPNNPSSLINNLASGTYEFRWTATGGGCSSFDIVEVVVYSDPVTAEAGPNQILAEFSTVTLAADVASAGTGTWTQVSGPSTVSFIDVNLATTAITGAEAGTYVFEWTVTNGNCANASDQVSITVNPISDLELTKTVSSTSVNIGDVVTFTVAVFNNDTSATNSNATGVSVSDVLPIGYSLVPGTVSNSGSFDLATQTITWNNLSVTNGATLNLTFNATVNATGPYVNTAQIIGSDNFDPDSTSNNDDGDQSEDDEDSALVTIQSADLSLVKGVQNAGTALPASVGDVITFELVVTNAGVNDATGIAIKDVIPAGYSNVTNISNGGALNGSTINWNNLGITAATGSVTLTYDVTVNTPAGLPNEYKNIAEITASDQFDPDSTTDNDDGDQSEDDETSFTIATPQTADLSLVKSVSDTTPNVGDTVTFTLLVSNDGDNDATNVSVEDVVPVGYSAIANPSNAANATIVGNTITWSSLTVTNGGSLSLTFDVVVDAPTGVANEYLNKAEITASDQYDIDSDVTSDADTDDNNDGIADDDESSISVVPEQADLSIAKAINDSTPNVGDTVTFTVTVTNAGPDVATGVSISDVVPNGYTIGTINNGGLATGTTITWSGLGVPANNGTISVSYEATINAPGAGISYTNNAEITASDQYDPDSDVTSDATVDDMGDGIADDDETSITPIVEQADLSLTKVVTDGNYSPVIGNQITFDIVVTNDGPNTATGVDVLDLLPSGYSYVSHTVSSGFYTPTTGLWDGLDDIPNGTSQTLTVTATVLATGNYNNIAEVMLANEFDVDSTHGNGVLSEDDMDDVVVTPVLSESDLSLTKVVTGGNYSPAIGSEITFDIVVTNAGPDTATGVDVLDLLPSGYSYVSHTVSSGFYTPTTGLWDGLDDMPNGTSQTLTVTATVLATGNYNNIAEIISSDGNDSDSVHGNGVLSEDDMDDTVVTPMLLESDLSLTKAVTDGNYSPAIGNEITFDIVVTNAGPDTATGVDVLDLLPSGYSYVSHTVSSGFYTPTTGLWDGLDDMPNGTSQTLTVTATVLATGDYNNIAEVMSANELDTDSTHGNGVLSEDDMDDTVVTPMLLESDLSLTKVVTDGNYSPVVGSEITFDIVVTNSGPDTATGVDVLDLLPSGYSYVSHTVSSGFYTPTTGLWDGLDNMPNGTSQTLTVTAIVLATGDYNNIAEVMSANELDTDSTHGNGVLSEDDMDDTVVTPTLLESDLSLTKVVTDGNYSPVVGNEITFDIVVTNSGPDTATGVDVLDLLPSGYSYVSHTVSSGFYTPTTGLWDGLDNMPNGTSQTLTVTATVLATGNYNNIAEVMSANELDTDSTHGNGVLSEDDMDDAVVIPTVPLADLSLTKEVVNGDITPLVGSEISFKITIRNDGPANATGVEVTDLLPSGYDFQTFSSSTGSYNEVTGIWTIGNLANGAIETLIIDVDVRPTGVYLNTTEITGSDVLDSDSTPGNGIKTEDDYSEVITNPVQGIADLSISKTTVSGRTIALPGDKLRFQITVLNDGPETATNVEAQDLLPIGFEYIQYSSTSGIYDAVTGLWGVGDIASGGSQTLFIDVFVKEPTDTPGEFINNAKITASDQIDTDPSDDTVSYIVKVPISDLSLTKLVSNQNPNVGDVITFTIRVDNEGPDVATGVDIVDVLPIGYSNPTNFISPPGLAIGSVNGNQIKWENLQIPIGGIDLMYDVTVNTPTQQVDEYKNTVQVTASAIFDPDATPNNDDGDQSEDDESSIAINTPAADIGIVKEVSVLGPSIGDIITFTITVTNEGNVAATSVSISEVLPAGYEYVSSVVTSGVYNQSSGLWNLPLVSVNGVELLEIRVKVLDINDYVNTAFLESLDQIDSNTNNDSSSAQITPICLTVHNKFSPNGNSENETFYIECIQNYPNNKLEIYNRWGNLVYSKVGYDNTFNGISNGRAVVKKDKELPMGTYYYVLDLGDGTKGKVGWLYIIR